MPPSPHPRPFSEFGSGPDAAYRAYVNRCLREFGYEPIGWR